MNHKCNGCKYKGEHQEMMFSSMGVCLRETNLIEAVKNYNAEKCPYKKTEECSVCSSDYNQEITSILIRYHTPNSTSRKIIETKFCPNCGRQLKQ